MKNAKAVLDGLGKLPKEFEFQGVISVDEPLTDEQQDACDWVLSGAAQNLFYLASLCLEMASVLDRCAIRMEQHHEGDHRPFLAEIAAAREVLSR